MIDFRFGENWDIALVHSNNDYYAQYVSDSLPSAQPKEERGFPVPRGRARREGRLSATPKVLKTSLQGGLSLCELLF